MARSFWFISTPFNATTVTPILESINAGTNELTDKGVAVVGIQTPETSLERDPQAVKEAARERGLYFPIMIDLESENWKAWGNTMWPTVYVVDKNGYIRHWWQGELNWKGATSDKVIEDLVDDLLAESEQSESSEITSSK